VRVFTSDCSVGVMWHWAGWSRRRGTLDFQWCLSELLTEVLEDKRAGSLICFASGVACIDPIMWTS